MIGRWPAQHCLSVTFPYIYPWPVYFVYTVRERVATPLALGWSQSAPHLKMCMVMIGRWPGLLISLPSSYLYLSIPTLPYPNGHNLLFPQGWLTSGHSVHGHSSLKTLFLSDQETWVRLAFYGSKQTSLILGKKLGKKQDVTKYLKESYCLYSIICFS